MFESGLHHHATTAFMVSFPQQITALAFTYEPEAVITMQSKFDTITVKHKDNLALMEEKFR